jgi:alpha-L-arabinofuranosidase
VEHRREQPGPVFAAADIHAHNTLEQRNNVVPQSTEAMVSALLFSPFPPASVTALRVELA